MLTETQKNELKQLFDGVVAEKLAPIRSEIDRLKQAVNAGNTDGMRDLKADVLHLDNEVRGIRSLLSTGRGTISSPMKFNGDEITLSPEEKREGLRLKLSETSLEDTAKMVAISKGVEPTNKPAFDRLMGIDAASIEAARERRARVTA